MKIIFRNSVALLLVFTMIFSLGVSVLALDEDMTDENTEYLTGEDMDQIINLEGQEISDEELTLDPEPVVQPELEPAKEEPQKKEEPEKPGEIIDKPEEAEEIEEYDPGAMLDGFPATTHPGNPTPIIKYAPGSLGSALVLRSKFGLMTTNLSDLKPGDVRTSKTATPVDGMVNTWDIKVRIEGRDHEVEQTTDVVLVIDRSGSMSSNNRMRDAKIAANSFIDKMIGDDTNLRIAVVSFSSDYRGAELVTIDHDFSNTPITLKNAVNGLSALGGTHTQAGIIQGSNLLIGSTADNKYMVLLSDGQPTYSYQPNTFTSTRPDWAPSGTSGTRTYGVYNGLFGNTVRGNGNAVISHYLSGTTRRYVHNGLAAIKAGVDARAGFDGLFTIAVEAGDEGTQILRDIASLGMNYSTNNPGDLQKIYNQIGTQIQTQNALKNVAVTDEMGDGFSLIGSVTKTEGNTAVAEASGGKNQAITWTINPAVTKPISDGSDVRYAEMTYRVEINDDILNINGAKTNEHQLFKTNKVTNLTYKDIDNEMKQVSITSPQVDPVLLKIKKILVSPNEPENRRFNVEISKVQPNSFNQTVELVPNADYVWLTSLRHEGTYQVEETSITGDGITNIGGFDISYKIDGENKTSFLVDHDGQDIPRGDVAIEVTNKQHGEATPDGPLIRVSKTFVGLTQNQIEELESFKITITSKSDSTKTRDLLLSEGDVQVETNGDITYKWEIEGWPAGTYTIAESGYEHENYDVVIENDGEVTIEAAKVTWKPALWKKPNTQVYNNLKVGGISPNIVATKLTQSDGVFVWTKTRLSASQRLAVIAAINDKHGELGLTADNGYWYSGEDIAGNDFYFRGHKIQYNYETGNLHIPQSNQWSLIVSGAYVFEGGDAADIGVKNTYTLKKVDVRIEKEVTGNMGDMTGEFSFTVDVAGEATARTFKIAHDGSHTLSNIPINAKLTLREESRGHKITVKVGGNTIGQNEDGSFTINPTGAGITIKVTNNKDELIDTGITFDSLPYILILALSTVGLGVGFVRRRNIGKED